MHTRKTQTINAVTSHTWPHTDNMNWCLLDPCKQKQWHQLTSKWFHTDINSQQWQSQRSALFTDMTMGRSKQQGFELDFFSWTEHSCFKTKLEIIITMMTFTLKLNISSSNAAALCLNTFICAQYECRHAWIANPLWFPTFKYFQRSRINCTNQK